MLIVTRDEQSRRGYPDCVRAVSIEGDSYPLLNNLIGARNVDCTERCIGGEWYDIWFDGEFRMKDFTQRTGVCLDACGGMMEDLWGNLFVCRCDPEGDMQSLTEDDRERILGCFVREQQGDAVLVYTVCPEDWDRGVMAMVEV